jgi:hypothetical protein
MKTDQEIIEKTNELIAARCTNYGAAIALVRWATEGMIELPPEEEWPEWADYWRIWFESDNVPDRKWVRMCNLTRTKWEPKDNDIVVAWDDFEEDLVISIDGACLYSSIKNCHEHFAIVENITDIGHDIAWFKANRKWR